MSEKIPIHNIDGVSICIKHDGHWKIEGYEKSFTEDQCERIVFGFSREKELSQKLAEREAELRESLEVIKFYAKKEVWGVDTPHMTTSIDPCDQEKLPAWGVRGGKRARTFLEKMEKKK